MATRNRTACEAQPCELGYHSRSGTYRCRHCYVDSQTLADDGSRHPIVGDYRVVCEGPVDSDETACAIGPSRPTPHITTAKELIDEHQQQAQDDDGCLHDAKIVQLSRD